jgi:hypothetical protein
VKFSMLFALALFTSFAASPLRAQAPAAVTDRLEAERLEQSGTVITIIFDDSGSMAGSKIKQAKAAFRQWITAVPASYRLGLVALNAGPLVPLARDNRPALQQAVDRINAAGGTPLVTTIRSAIAEIDRRRGVVGPYERHIILVFTDGEDTTSEGVAGVQRELARASDAGIETVGIGYHGEGNYMRNAATRYYDANNLAELQQSLAKVDAEIGDTSDIVIDERTRATMQHVVASAPVSTAVVPESKPGTSKSKGHPFRLSLVLIIIAWIVLRTMMRRQTR